MTADSVDTARGLFAGVGGHTEIPSSRSRSESRSRSLGTSLKEESDNKQPGDKLNSSRHLYASGGIVVLYKPRLAGLGEGISIVAVWKYLDVTSSLGVTPGESRVIKNPIPTVWDLAIIGHSGILPCCCFVFRTPGWRVEEIDPSRSFVELLLLVAMPVSRVMELESM